MATVVRFCQISSRLVICGKVGVHIIHIGQTVRDRYISVQIVETWFHDISLNGVSLDVSATFVSVTDEENLFSGLICAKSSTAFSKNSLFFLSDGQLALGKTGSSIF